MEPFFVGGTKVYSDDQDGNMLIYGKNLVKVCFIGTLRLMALKLPELQMFFSNDDPALTMT